MATVHPYLNFNGNTEEAFRFYQTVFGGEFLALQRFREMPGAEKIPADALDKILHIALRIGNDTMLMGTDAIESMGQHLNMGNNFSICLRTESEAEADRLFQALSAGGTVQMPLEKAFWGDYFGMLTDRFGVQWMVSYSYQQPQAATTYSEALEGQV